MIQPKDIQLNRHKLGETIIMTKEGPFNPALRRYPGL